MDQRREHPSKPKKTSPYSRKFRFMLEMIRHPDGGKWTPSKMERATGEQVSASYFSYLRDGQIGIPRADKIELIARAMDFPPELWFRELSWWEGVYDRFAKGEDVVEALKGQEVRANGGRISQRLNWLFQARVNEQTGNAFTNGEVAALSKGRLTEEEVTAMREGRAIDPTWVQVLALCDVFEVDPSYWSERRFPWRPSADVLKGVEDQDSYVVFQNSLNLSKRNRNMLRILSEHLRREEQRGEEEER